jgi:hypothetical protein
MTISRMQMERQLRAGGGLMTLEEPRQGYFLGKIVKKAKRAVKKVVKSPLGKAALLGAIGFGIPGTQIGGLFGRAAFGGAAPSIFGQTGGIGALLGQGGKFSTLGDIFRVGGKAGAKLSIPRLLGGGLGAAAIAAPFFMGGEEEVEEETPFTETPSSIANIVEQARNQDPSLRFLPKPKFVDNFYAADGGLATLRENFDEGKMALGEGFKSKELNDMALDMFGKNLRLLSRDELELLRDEYNIKKGMTEVEAKDGGLMDLGGMEKDYREGGFVPLGAEERADDVPARLSKNEFVFTADAVRNAGGGDIDKGAEVMQNMMDNLEAGGMISEESQGMNPAQEMFDQSQMLEGRLA